MYPQTVWSGTRRLIAASAAVSVAAAMLIVGVVEYSADRHQSAVSHLVEMQSASQTSVAWTDDPLGVTNDRVLKALEEGS